MKRGMNQTAKLTPFLRPLLAPLSVLYSGVVRLRNRRYDKPAARRRADMPVLSVGNITVGGTGKTPLVMETVRVLRRLGRKPAILTRGYGAGPNETADEVREYAELLPETPVVVDPDRLAGAATARREHDVDCLVLDDGFQHRRLERDLDLVVIDALDPWGGGRVLPAGRLREPLCGLRRAHLFVISRVNQVEPRVLEDITRGLASYNARADILHADVKPQTLVMSDEREANPEVLAYHNVLPVCGIGAPLTFLASVAGLSGRVCGRLIFKDHQRYAEAHVRRIVARARKCSADLIVTTRKDWVKLAPLWRRLNVEPELDLARLDVRMVLRDPDELFTRHLNRVMERRREP